ncbi:MAG TPA: PAS domain S-box protein [Methylomirabilota bacterium]|nr:PAS domain S-box protein [Methylomirabilota bacterium]
MTDLGPAEQLRAVFALSPAVLTVTDLESGRIVDVNDAFLRITGYDREEVIGRTIPEMGLWMDPAQREAGIAELRAGRPVRGQEARFQTKAGREVWAVASAGVVEMDGRPRIVTILIDITDRVRAETALRESERRFAQAFHANPLPMSIVSLRDGRHLDVNEAAVRHSGYAREELLGRTKPELGFWVAEGERERLLRQLHGGGQARDFEVTFRTKGGEQRQLLVNSEVITYAGEPAVLSVSLDITERKEADAARESRREEAESLSRSKDEFLAMLGHELRNPLGTITNTLGVLDRVVGDAHTRRLLDIIGRQTSHLGRLVDDLLDVARVTSGKIDLRLQALDLRALAQACVDALVQAGRARAHQMTVEGPAVHVSGDPARLEQVISNLLDNAVKYTPAGGKVSVVLETIEGDAVLRVRDTGEGIRPELLDRIFDLFVQEPQALDRTRGGLGLGLTLVRRLVELHGGSVAAESAGAGRGSEFSIRLPATAAAVATGRGVAAAPGPARRRVLVVEDNEDARESLTLLLRLGGHEVFAAANAEETLARVGGIRPEVMLIDVGLPGMDGYDLARALRERPEGREMRLVALTGYGQAEDQRRARAAGFDLHLTKPVDPRRLEQALANPRA